MVETEMIEYRLNGPASQERIRIRLMAALRENRFPQSILIDGPVGIGKKRLQWKLPRRSSVQTRAFARAVIALAAKWQPIPA